MANYYKRTDELYHKNGYKYIDKVWRNGRWRYVYDEKENDQGSSSVDKEESNARDKYKRARNRRLYQQQQLKKVEKKYNNYVKALNSSASNSAATPSWAPRQDKKVSDAWEQVEKQTARRNSADAILESTRQELVSVKKRNKKKRK